MTTRGIVTAMFSAVFLCLIVTPIQAATYFYHNDHLGTPQALSDSTQQVVWEVNAKPFGDTNVTTESVVQNIRFPGQYLDSETELHYNYFRAYYPVIGRYISPDPIGILYDYSSLVIPLEQLQTRIVLDEHADVINKLFGYVEQNPLKNFDTYGLGSEGTPGNNTAQNKQVNDICRELKLTKDQRNTLHDEITGQNYGYHDIRQLAIELFKR